MRESESSPEGAGEYKADPPPKTSSAGRLARKAGFALAFGAAALGINETGSADQLFTNVVGGAENRDKALTAARLKPSSIPNFKK